MSLQESLRGKVHDHFVAGLEGDNEEIMKHTLAQGNCVAKQALVCRNPASIHKALQAHGRMQRTLQP